MSDISPASSISSHHTALEAIRATSLLYSQQLEETLLDTLLTPQTSISINSDIMSEDPEDPPVPTPPSDKTYSTAGGLQFSINPTEPIVNTPPRIGILYKKEHRPTIGSKEEAELIKSITAKQGDLFKEINTSFKDPDSLKNNLTLGQRLTKTESVWKSADLLNPCNILFPIGDSASLEEDKDGNIKELYLFTHYRQITADQVAASCKYYAKYVRFPLPNTTELGTFARELEWTYSYFGNNVESRTYEITQKGFQGYEPIEQGGPLFLKLLLDHLVVSNDTSESALISTVFSYNIKNLNKTEDIFEVTKLLSAITDTIIAIRDHKDHPLLDDYLQHLTTIFQTSSVEAFNRTFSKLEDDVIYSRRFRKCANAPSLLP